MQYTSNSEDKKEQMTTKIFLLWIFESLFSTAVEKL